MKGPEEDIFSYGLGRGSVDPIFQGGMKRRSGCYFMGVDFGRNFFNGGVKNKI